MPEFVTTKTRTRALGTRNMSKEHNGPNQSFFEIPFSVIKNSDEVEQYLDTQDYLRAADRQTLSVLLSVASNSPVDQMGFAIVSLSEIQTALQNHDLPATRVTVINKAKKFAEYGLFNVASIESMKGGQPRLKFTMAPVHKSNFKSAIEEELEQRIQGRRITRRARTNSKKIISYLQESDAQYLKALEASKPQSENFFTGILDRAMRFNTAEHIEGNIIQNEITHNGTRIIVQSTTQTGRSSQIAALPDQRVIRAIVSEIAGYIEDQIKGARMDLEKSLFSGQPSLLEAVEIDGNNGTVSRQGLADIPESEIEDYVRTHIKNRWVFDVVKLAKKMGYAQPNSGSTRALINRALQRLYETNFRIAIRDQDTDKIHELMMKFGLSDRKQNFRFITDLKSQYEQEFAENNSVRGTSIKDLFAPEDESNMSDEDVIDPFSESELRRVRFWQISIDDYLFNRLLDKESRAVFAAHNEIMRESSGLAQTLYNFCNHRIGRTNQRILDQEERRYTNYLSALHNELWATRTYEGFEKHFIELMKRHMPKEQKFDRKAHQNTARMFGYIFVLVRKPEGFWLNISRDRQDQLNGDRSYHNTLLAKSRKGMDTVKALMNGS